MKNILLLFSGIFQTGGIEKYTRDFLEAIVLSGSSFSGNAIVMNDIKAPDLPDRIRIRFFCCGSKYKFIRKIKFAFFFICITLLKKPSFILSNHIGLLRLYFFARPFLKIDYGLMAYGVDVYNLSFIGKKIFERAAFVTSISSYTSRKLLEQVDIKEKIRLIPPSVDGTEFFPKTIDERLISKYKLKGKKVLLTVCRLSLLEQYKGCDKVILALPKVLKKIPKLKYLIVGKGDDIYRLQKLVRENGLNDIVNFCGFIPQEELIDYYNLANLYVMPSRNEGFGIVFIEALACGTPVIAGNKDGSVEAVLNGMTGTLVDPNNIEEIASVIINLLNGNVNSDMLNKNFLREHVLRTYGKEQFNSRIKALLAELRR